MDSSVIQKISDKIRFCRFGTIFFVSSFPEYDEEYVTKLLPKFEKEGLLTRIAKGVYIKAEITQFGPVFPPVSEIVAKIAKRDHCRVIPAGETAINKLGFSDQVPMNPIYLTDGSTRKLKLGHRIVTLKHGAPRNFSYKGKLISELVQALSAIGQQNIDSDTLKRVSVLIAEQPEPETFAHDVALAPSWIRSILKNAHTTKD